MNTVLSEHGDKEHIVEKESELVSAGSDTYCGMTFYIIGGRGYDSVDDIPNVCGKCKQLYES